tara:strand:- start:174 stop:401 length:228 start_codon:yes stop_codon:yes gene_type:complete
MKTIINGMTGNIENVYSNEPKKELSKNQKRKAKRYGKKSKIIKVLGITAYQYACVETHRARFGVNPELKLIITGC